MAKQADLYGVWSGQVNGSESLSDEDYQWLMYHLKIEAPYTKADKDRCSLLFSRLKHLTGDNWRERTALHEAGHAVVARSCGCGVSRVSLFDDDSGEVPWTSSLSTGSDNLRSRLIKLLEFAAVVSAGYVSEEIQWGYARCPETQFLGRIAARWQEFAPYAPHLPLEDWKNLVSKSTGVGVVGTWQALIEDGERRAQRILRANWNPTRALADRLLVHNELHGEPLESLLSAVKLSSIDRVAKDKR